MIKVKDNNQINNNKYKNFLLFKNNKNKIRHF